MRKLSVILAVASLVTGSIANAGTTDTIPLSATIASAVDIDVTPHANASALDLTANQTDLVVGTALEDANTRYRVKANSANNGQIKHSSLANNVGYTMSYSNGGSTNLALTTTDAIIYDQATPAIYTDVSHSVTISYTGSSTLPSGSYSDTINFTIEAY